MVFKEYITKMLIYPDFDGTVIEHAYPEIGLNLTLD